VTLASFEADAGLPPFMPFYGQRWVKTGLKISLLGFSYFVAIVGLTLLIVVGTVVWLAVK